MGWNLGGGGERNLLHIDNDWGVAVFGTDDDINKSTNIYVDGTFRTAPHPYTQFFTIHAELNYRVLYCVSALMTDKTIGAYSVYSNDDIDYRSLQCLL